MSHTRGGRPRIGDRVERVRLSNGRLRAGGPDFPSNAENVGGAALTLPHDSSGVWLRLVPGHYAVRCWKGDHLSRGMAWIELHLTPGRYFMVCQVPAKADGRPHYKIGMVHEFSIE